MASSEEGGNQPLRTLLVGGPKHGDYMNLASYQVEYKFVGFRTLMPSSGPTWNAFPENSEHVYKFDSGLTQRIYGSKANKAVFVHEVIADGPDHGGFALHAVRTALRELEEAKEGAIHNAEQIVERDRQLGAFQERYEKLLSDYEDLSDRMQAVRNELEVTANGLHSLLRTTGRDYQPIVIGT